MSLTTPAIGRLGSLTLVLLVVAFALGAGSAEAKDGNGHGRGGGGPPSSGGGDGGSGDPPCMLGGGTLSRLCTEYPALIPVYDLVWNCIVNGPC